MRSPRPEPSPGSGAEGRLPSPQTLSFMIAVVQWSPGARRETTRWLDAPGTQATARIREYEQRFVPRRAPATTAIMKEPGCGALLHVEDPQTPARPLLGALTRGGMLIANSSQPAQTRDAVAEAFRALLAGLATTPPGWRPLTPNPDEPKSAQGTSGRARIRSGHVQGRDAASRSGRIRRGGARKSAPGPDQRVHRRPCPGRAARRGIPPPGPRSRSASRVPSAPRPIRGPTPATTAGCGR
jgi:hypothetical protein